MQGAGCFDSRFCFLVNSYWLLVIGNWFMRLLKKTVEITTSNSKEYLVERLEQLSGWQINRSWQQGRVRKLKIKNEQQSKLSWITSFMIIPVAQLNIEINDVQQGKELTIKVEESFSWGVSIFVAYILVFLVAIYASQLDIWVMLPFYVLVCGIGYKAFHGIYRDRENLITDFLDILNHS